jgi:MarR family 2-MHQ and catechol resistance regulon transcriptional repressor
LDDLTITQFGVLEVLYHLGSLSQKQIGAKLLKSGGNMTLVIDNLVKHGYVQRRRCEEDRRVTFVDLTPAGRAKLEAVLPVHVAAIVEEMSILSAGEQVELGRLLRKLGRGNEAANGIAYNEGVFDYEI